MAIQNPAEFQQFLENEAPRYRKSPVAWLESKYIELMNSKEPITDEVRKGYAELFRQNGKEEFANKIEGEGKQILKKPEVEISPYPNDREPIDEELAHKGATDQWYREKGPYFAACVLVYRSIKVNGSVSLNDVSYQLDGIFRELKDIQGWEYAHAAEYWYRQKTQTAPAFGLGGVPSKTSKLAVPNFIKKSS